MVMCIHPKIAFRFTIIGNRRRVQPMQCKLSFAWSLYEIDEPKNYCLVIGWHKTSPKKKVYLLVWDFYFRLSKRKKKIDKTSRKTTSNDNSHKKKKNKVLRSTKKATKSIFFLFLARERSKEQNKLYNAER